MGGELKEGWYVTSPPHIYPLLQALQVNVKQIATMTWHDIQATVMEVGLTN